MRIGGGAATVAPAVAIHLRMENNRIRLRAILQQYLNLVSGIIPTHEDYAKLLPEERRIYSEELPAIRAELKNFDLHGQSEMSSQQPMATSFVQDRVSSRGSTKLFSQSSTLKDDLTTSAATTSNSYKHLHLPKGMMAEFLAIAEENTQKNLETCGFLTGKEERNEFYINTLIIPQQRATSDTCNAIGEEQILKVQVNNSLQTFGWIHTHPSQLCFMSSVDLHTQLSYQLLTPEAIAVVMAPTDRKSPHGIFHLCKPHGISTIAACRKSEFHEHEGDEPIYERCSHVTVDPELAFTIVDLRPKKSST